MLRWAPLFSSFFNFYCYHQLQYTGQGEVRQAMFRAPFLAPSLCYGGKQSNPEKGCLVTREAAGIHCYLESSEEWQQVLSCLCAGSQLQLPVYPHLLPHYHRSEELTRWWYWWCYDLCVWETYVGSAPLFYSDASGLVARRGQDSWGWIRLQELPEGDKCAIRPPLELHSGFLLGLLPLLVTQSRGLYRVLSATVSWAQGSRRQGQAQMI